MIMKFKTINTVLIAAAFFTFDFAYSQQVKSDTVTGAKEKNIQEVVLIGYGGVKKKDATGAITSLKADDFNKGTNTTPEQLLQGKAAGVQISASSGDPSSKSTVRIRGFSTIRSGGDPLYVVDGVPLSSGDDSSGRADIGFGGGPAGNPLSYINPDDIASIDVLKDAGAIAIYGSRGANGVIIITTKKGRQGAGQLTFNATGGFSNISHKYDLLSPAQFAANTLPANNFGQSIDPFKAILQTGSVQQYNLSYGGGSDTGNYRVSLGYLDQKGIIQHSGLTKTNVSYNVNQKFFNNKLNVESSVNTAFIRSTTPPTADTSGAEGDIIISALRWNPTRSLYDPSTPSGYTIIADNPRNPLNLLNYYTDITKTFRTVGNIGATLDLAKGLDYKVNFGVDYSTSERDVAASNLINIQIVSGTAGGGGVASIANSSKYSYVVEHTLNYNADIADKLKLNALAGYSFQQFDSYGQSNVVTGYGNNHDQNYYLNNIFAGTVQNTSGTGQFTQGSYHDATVKNQSYFGRAILTYDNKYVLSGIFRRDGSSKFGNNRKYGNFPAISAAWNIDKESFAPSFFNTLKLRGGYGLTGNQDFPAGVAYGYYQPLSGNYRPVNTPNTDLSWEETAQYNAGIDFGLMQNKLSGSIDVYNKTTKNILWFYPTILLPSDVAGYWVNLKNTRLSNKGLEFTANYKAVNTENFKLEVGGNVAYNITKATGVLADKFDSVVGIKTGIINGQGLTDEYAQGHFEGQELYTFNLLQFRGFDTNGMSLYETANGGTTSNLADAVKMYSGSALPKYNVGVYLKGNYKQWDFAINGYGQYGAKIYDNTANALFYGAALTSGTNVTQDIIGNGEAKIGNANAASTRFLHSADFFRLSNMSIGYTLKGEGGMFNVVKSVRFNLTAQNLFIITGYKGFDPEVNTNKAIGGVPSYGIDYASYPKARTFSLGVNVNF
jgi:TonB-linked SusC/RagA family outer membrane protein